MGSEKKRFSEIQCPICKKQFKSKVGLTLNQWKTRLLNHLIVPPKHNLPPEEAKPVIAKYFESLGINSRKPMNAKP
jgi:hypothetical protein